MHYKYFLLLSTAQSQAQGLVHAKHMFCHLAALQFPSGETHTENQAGSLNYIPTTTTAHGFI